MSRQNSRRRPAKVPVFTEVDPAALAHLVAAEENLNPSAPDSVLAPPSPLDSMGSPFQEVAEIESETEVDSEAEAGSETEVDSEAEAPPSGASGASLKSRVGGGVRWSSLGAVVAQVLNLARSAALTRLLLQSDFGLMGMAGTLSGALGVLTATGMGGSVVATKFESDEQMHRHLNTIWTVELMRGAFLALALWLSTPWIARFYGEDRLYTMMPVLALTPLVGSCTNIGMTLLSRGVEIKRATQFSLSSNISVLVITIGLAFWWRNVWALVWGQVLGSLIATVLTYWFHPYRPRFEIDREALKTAFSFGKWMFIIGVMVYITTTVDNVFVGKLMGARALGPYVAAYSIANLPTSLVAQIFGSVFFPAFAELGREDTARLESVVERVFQIGAALLMLISLPVALFAGELVTTLFGARWAEAAGPLRILVLVGLFRGFIQMISPLILGLNKPEIEGKSKIAEAVLFLALIYPMVIHFGTLGAASTGAAVYGFALLTRYRWAWHLAPRAFAKLPLIVLRLAGALAGGALAGELVRHALWSVGWNRAWIVLFGAGSVTVLVTLALMVLVSSALRAQLAPVLGKLKRA